MRDDDLFIVASWCFSPIDQDAWESVISPDVWEDFLNSLSDLSQGQLSADIRHSLSTPPSYQEKEDFASKHFTGGLPESALPVESLYVYEKDGSRSQEYLREPALYMRDLFTSMGLSVPTAFMACPDHISLQLEVVGMLLSENPDYARDFALSRFEWLSRYREHLESINVDASFYASMIRGLECVFDAWRKGK